MQNHRLSKINTRFWLSYSLSTLTKKIYPRTTTSRLERFTGSCEKLDPEDVSKVIIIPRGILECLFFVQCYTQYNRGLTKSTFTKHPSPKASVFHGYGNTTIINTICNTTVQMLNIPKILSTFQSLSHLWYYLNITYSSRCYYHFLKTYWKTETQSRLVTTLSHQLANSKVGTGEAPFWNYALYT